MLTLKIGWEIILYFNNKQHTAVIMQIDFGEIIWVKFEDEPEKQEYYHIDELKKMMNPNHIAQIIDGIEECLYEKF